MKINKYKAAQFCSKCRAEYSYEGNFVNGYFVCADCLQKMGKPKKKKKPLTFGQKVLLFILKALTVIALGLALVYADIKYLMFLRTYFQVYNDWLIAILFLVTASILEVIVIESVIDFSDMFKECLMCLSISIVAFAAVSFMVYFVVSYYHIL